MCDVGEVAEAGGHAVDDGARGPPRRRPPGARRATALARRGGERDRARARAPPPRAPARSRRGRRCEDACGGQHRWGSGHQRGAGDYSTPAARRAALPAAAVPLEWMSALVSCGRAQGWHGRLDAHDVAAAAGRRGASSRRASCARTRTPLLAAAAAASATAAAPAARSSSSCPFLGTDAEGQYTCRIYDKRFAQCRLYPLHAADLRELEGQCSYTFEAEPSPPRAAAARARPRVGRRGRSRARGQTCRTS